MAPSYGNPMQPHCDCEGFVKLPGSPYGKGLERNLYPIRGPSSQARQLDTEWGASESQMVAPCIAGLSRKSYSFGQRGWFLPCTILGDL